MNKKKSVIYLACLIIFLNIFIFNFGSEINSSNVTLSFQLQSETDVDFQIFYSENTEMVPEKSELMQYDSKNELKEMKFHIKANSNYIRLDFGSEPSKMALSDIKLIYREQELPIDAASIVANQIQSNVIEDVKVEANKLNVISNGTDPFVLIDLNGLNVHNWILNYDKSYLMKEKLTICVALDVILICIYIFAKRLFTLPVELYRNKKLIYKLAKNDFKTKYAGSYFGIFWAFVQPVVTILLYWFVFQVGLRSSNMGNYPFVLWLIAGLVPWFYFSDGLNYGTNSLLEYSYLVKKVVFNISILPVVKIVSALFVHIFFLIFALIVFATLGYPPKVYSIQVIYYTICIFILSLSISYFTSAIVLFFRDLGQIINIVLQVGMWMTPIMWQAEMLPDSFKWIFKMNPMYYIVRGYRESLLEKIWFMQHLEDTFLFWLTVGGIFILGMLIFRRLKPHFADVL